MEGRSQRCSVMEGVEVSEEMEKLLSLWLKLEPVRRLNKSKTEVDLKRLKIRLMWMYIGNVEQMVEG